jgi:hypothetical protein
MKPCNNTREQICLTVPKNCYILCNIFRCTIEDILLFYMDHVSFDRFLKDEADKDVGYTTYFFIKYTAEIELG